LKVQKTLWLRLVQINKNLGLVLASKQGSTFFGLPSPRKTVSFGLLFFVYPMVLACSAFCRETAGFVIEIKGKKIMNRLKKCRLL
jgi:hypothetical protein